MALRKLLVDPATVAPIRPDWRTALPETADDQVALRELRRSDAPSLLRHLNTPAVLRYMAPCPTTVAGFERFIAWTHRERRRGAFACYGIVPVDCPSAVGVIQFWPIERDFSTAEWGFALGEPYWRNRLFLRAATLAIDVVFSEIGVHRLEARSVDANVAGNAVLERLGATPEGVLHAGFRKDGVVRDHIMWSILASSWVPPGRRARCNHTRPSRRRNPN